MDTETHKPRRRNQTAPLREALLHSKFVLDLLADDAKASQAALIARGQRVIDEALAVAI